MQLNGMHLRKKLISFGGSFEYRTDMPTSKKRPQLAMDDETYQRIESLVQKTAHLDMQTVMRECLSRGLASLEMEVYGAENRRLVNRKQKQRQGSMAEALQVLKDKVAGRSDAEVAAAIAALEKGLSD